MKRTLCLALLVILLFGLTSPALAAASNPVAPCYTDISAITATLRIDKSTGLATCIGEMNAHKIKPVKVIVMLQYLNGNSWSPLASWSGTGTYVASASGSRYVLEGYKYRVAVTAIVYNDDGLPTESAVIYDYEDY